MPGSEGDQCLHKQNIPPGTSEGDHAWLHKQNIPTCLGVRECSTILTCPFEVKCPQLLLSLLTRSVKPESESRSRKEKIQNPSISLAKVIISLTFDWVIADRRCCVNLCVCETTLL